jgi:hypothetical protein
MVIIFFYASCRHGLLVDTFEYSFMTLQTFCIFSFSLYEPCGKRTNVPEVMVVTESFLSTLDIEGIVTSHDIR